MTDDRATATAIAIAAELPDWNLIDEISIPLLETGVATLPVLQAALPTILSIDCNDEKAEKTFKKIFRIAQLEIQYLLRTQQEILKHMEKLESDHNAENQKKSLKSAKKERKITLDLSESLAKFKCIDCGKIFLNENFLTSHFERRHPKLERGNSAE